MIMVKKEPIGSVDADSLTPSVASSGIPQSSSSYSSPLLPSLVKLDVSNSEQTETNSVGSKESRTIVTSQSKPKKEKCEIKPKKKQKTAQLSKDDDSSNEDIFCDCKDNIFKHNLRNSTPQSSKDLSSAIKTDIERFGCLFQSNLDDQDCYTLQITVLKKLYHDLRYFCAHVMESNISRNSINLTSLLVCVSELIKNQIPVLSVTSVITSQVAQIGRLLWRRKKWALKVLLVLISYRRQYPEEQNSIFDRFILGQAIIDMLDQQCLTDANCPARVVALSMRCLASLCKNQIVPTTISIRSTIVSNAINYTEIEDKVWNDKEPKSFLNIHSSSHQLLTCKQRPNNYLSTQPRYVLSALHHLASNISLCHREYFAMLDEDDVFQSRVSSKNLREKIVALSILLGVERRKRYDTSKLMFKSFEWQRYQLLALEALINTNEDLFKAHFLLWLGSSFYKVKCHLGYDAELLLNFCLRILINQEGSTIVQTCAVRCILALRECSKLISDELRGIVLPHRVAILSNIARIYRDTDLAAVFSLIEPMGLLDNLVALGVEMTLVENSTSLLLEQLSHCLLITLKSSVSSLINIERECEDSTVYFMTKVISLNKNISFTTKFRRNMIEIIELMSVNDELVQGDLPCDCGRIITQVFLDHPEDLHLGQAVRALYELARPRKDIIFLAHVLFHENSFTPTSKDCRLASRKKLQLIYEHCRFDLIEQFQGRYSEYVAYLLRFLFEVWLNNRVTFEADCRSILKLFVELVVDGLAGTPTKYQSDECRYDSPTYFNLVLALVYALVIDFPLVCEAFEKGEAEHPEIQMKMYLDHWLDLNLCGSYERIVARETFSTARLLTLFVNKSQSNQKRANLIDNKQKLMKLTLVIVQDLARFKMLRFLEGERRRLLSLFRPKQLRQDCLEVMSECDMIQIGKELKFGMS